MQDSLAAFQSQMGCLELISVACVRNDKAVFQSIPTLAEKLAPEEGTLLIASPKISGAERARIAIQQGQAVEGSPTKTFGVVGTETRSEKAKSTHCREEKSSTATSSAHVKQG